MPTAHPRRALRQPSMQEIFDRVAVERHVFAADVLEAALDLAGLGCADDDTPQGYRDERLRRYARRVFEQGGSPSLNLLGVNADQAEPVRRLALEVRSGYLRWQADRDASDDVDELSPISARALHTLDGLL